MNKSRCVILGLVAAALVGIVAIQVAPLLKWPQFEIVNKSPHVVFVTASWRNESREIGSIQPSSTYVFSIEDEAAIKFSGRYSDGRELESEEIYFTGGTVVVATITENGVEVRYDLER